MIYKLTVGTQINKINKKGKRNSHFLYFLNDVLILKHKKPFDENWENGYQHRTCISDIYLLNGNIYQTREDSDNTKRNVRYPASKNILKQFNIPKDMKIMSSVYNKDELDRIKKLNSLYD